MMHSMRSYVVAENYFEKEYPDNYKHLEGYKGFVAQKLFHEHNYYIICTIDRTYKTVCMFVISDCPIPLEESALHNLIIRMNDTTRKVSIKRNPSGICYSYCSHDILSEPIPEGVIAQMTTECLCYLMDLEIQAQRIAAGEGVLSDQSTQHSIFPFQVCDIKLYLDGTKNDPWSIDAPSLSPSEERLKRFFYLTEYERAQKWFLLQKEKTMKHDVPGFTEE